MREVEITYDNKKAKLLIKNEEEHIQKHWAAGMFYETQRNGLLNVMYNRHKDAKLIVDIGASIGNHTVFFSTIMGADVVAFEPYWKSYDHLKDNLMINDLSYVQFYQVALGSEGGWAEMFNMGDNQIGMCQVREDDNGDVQIATLDSFYNQVVNFDAMKIDVEHYNEKLLKGAERVLTDGKGDVYIEAETDEVLTITDKYMTKYGYVREPGIKLNHTPTYIYHKA